MVGLAESARSVLLGRDRHYANVVVVTTIGGALVAWLVTFSRMDGMDGGPGTALGSLAWYAGVWVTMMAAMMLPAVVPVTQLVARTNAGRDGRVAGLARTWLFVLGYLAVWTALGLVAYAAYRLVIAVEDGALAWDRAGPWVAGGAVAAAGLYQLTPLKRVCLRHCRTPLHFVVTGWRPGALGAIRMGSVHAAYCVGCCIGLMVVLFAVGVMSLFWMTAVAAVIFVEKVVPHGEGASRAFAVALVALGIWIAVAPDSVPWLTTPGGMMSHMTKMEGG